MESWHAYLLIVLILGVIVSNMVAIRHLDKIKIPPLVKKQAPISPTVNQKLDELESQLQQHQQRHRTDSSGNNVKSNHS